MDLAFLDNPNALNVLAWAALAIVLLLSLPASEISKFVLEIVTLALRLALWMVLAAGIFLWLRPEALPPVAEELFQQLPQEALDILPAPGEPIFGLVMASIIVGVFLPVLAMLDVTRKLSGSHLRRLRALSREKPLIENAIAHAQNGRVVEHVHASEQPAAARGTNVHAAAATIATAPSQRKPARVADYVK